MNTPRTSVLSTLVLTLCLPALAPAQTNTSATLAGSSDLQVLNAARASATASINPVGHEELWSEGVFLGARTRYYSVVSDVYGTTSSLGSGSWALRIGSNTVLSGFALPWLARPVTSVGGDVFASDVSKQYTIGGIPVVVSGNVTANLRIDMAYRFAKNGAIMDGKLTGAAHGRAKAQLAYPILYFGATESHTLDFGEQRFDGKVEVWSTGDNSQLRYEMDEMRVYLTASSTVFGATWYSTVIAASTRAAIRIASFL